MLRSPLLTLTTYFWVREGPTVYGIRCHRGREDMNLGSIFHHVCLIYCLSGPSVSEAGCTWQASRALLVPLGQLCRRIWHFTPLLGAELTRNRGYLKVLAFSILPTGNRKCKWQKFTVNGASKTIIFCFDKTRILFLALKQSDVVIYNVHYIYTYMRCE